MCVCVCVCVGGGGGGGGEGGGGWTGALNHSWKITSGYRFP